MQLLLMASKKYQIETPETHPHLVFRTRRFRCPDGVTRLVTFPESMWYDFDRYINSALHSYSEQIAQWTDSELNDDGYGHTFSDSMHYWIIINRDYEWYEKRGKDVTLTPFFNQSTRKTIPKRLLY